ncbi:MAG: hypothetical protein KJP08_01020 [Gammaproteobacteria bacterium]|nr:hypothetical protein [Gammaproteobacteria bacterium]MBT8093364.1 hypothetical protein [Gammaproteobacteria bacterium]MBT8104381.1 hypothetical protein [Gammaproteobacteria bacterium]NNK24397.1 hypothetical protein [Woeseiaceae bacterium]
MLKSQFSRIATLVVFVGVCAVLGAQTASADGDRRVYLRFAGDFIQNLEQRDAVGGVPTDSTSLFGLVRAKVKGNLGRADLTGVTKSKGVETGPEYDPRCPDYFLKIVDITDNNLVFTFSDLSLLYGDGTGVVCVNFATGEEYVAVEGVWLGGTKRFRNAKGEFSIRFDESVLVNANTQVTAETGRIFGTLSHHR